MCQISLYSTRQKNNIHILSFNHKNVSILNEHEFLRIVAGLYFSFYGNISFSYQFQLTIEIQVKMIKRTEKYIYKIFNISRDSIYH
ncbi:hypothetical protein BpHYR1_038605 [Brachionus plicatilis]|uniref:Uncharacterized protein n=1 Tax=Brachionus plicatilis TaxID=10195 RepID=A0A3M7RLQ3_BRAPC|nr:hypothetical protein BpHYR1_038605 [Brachionus plicatilis]